MRVTVRVFGSLHRYRPGLVHGAISLDVQPGTTVGRIVRQLGIPDAVPLVIMVNSTVCDLDSMPTDGDSLYLFPPMAGG
jgi:molybdopterin converting factor small subunit